MILAAHKVTGDGLRVPPAQPAPGHERLKGVGNFGHESREGFLIIARSRCRPPDNMAEEKIIPHKFAGHVCRWSKEPHKAPCRFAARYRGQRWSSARTFRLKSPRHPLRHPEYQSHQEASGPC